MDLAKAVQAMEESPPIELILRGEAAIALVALMELSLRHPQVVGTLVAEVGQTIVAGVRRNLPAEALTLVNRDFPPDCDQGEPA